MPVVAKWLPPFVVPLFLLLVVLLAGATVAFGTLGSALIFMILAVALVAWRLRYLKSHPPDPELVAKPFWKF